MHSPEVKAARRENYAQLAGFMFGLGCALSVSLWLLHQLHTSGIASWELIMPGTQLLLWSFLAGGLGSLIGFLPLRWWHHRLGLYRCFRCEQPLRFSTTSCSCISKPPITIQQIINSPSWSHQRWIVLTYVALAFLAFLTIQSAPRSGFYTQWIRTWQMHFLLSLLVCCLVELVIGILSLTKRGQTIRPRLQTYLYTLVLWPLFNVILWGVLLSLKIPF